MSEHVVLILDDLTPIPIQQPQSRTESLINTQDTLTNSSNKGCASPETIGNKKEDDNLSMADNKLPPPKARKRWFFGHDEKSTGIQEERDVEENDINHGGLVALAAVEEVQPAVNISRATKYTKFVIPKGTARKTHYDIVLGVSTQDLNQDTVEAIIVTFNQVADAEISQSEVITSKELARLSVEGDETNEGDDRIWKWKLHEKVFLSEATLEVVIEIRTWDLDCHHDDGDDEGVVVGNDGGALSPSYYDSLTLHFVELLTNARDYYSKDPRYREHQPFVHSVDINRTGHQVLKLPSNECTQTVSDYYVSGDGSHVVLATVAGEKEGEKTYFLQLWSFQDRETIILQYPEKTASLEEEGFQPNLVAWMQFPATMKQWNSDPVLSWDGSQVVVLDLEPLSLSPDERKEYRTTTAFYRCNINHTQAPEGAVAGSGLVRHYPERADTAAGLEGFCGRGQFHIVATTDQNVRDELFVTCDGVTIEIYSIYGEWTHIRSILMNPERKGPDFIINVYSALSKQLRSAYFVVEEPGTDHVITWDIEKGVCVSSFAGLSSPEQNYNISNISAMSADGQMIALPGRRHIDLFWTATWTLLGTCVFHDMELMECIGYVQFSRFDTQLVVGIGFGSDARESFTFYRKNRGYILNTATMMVVERFVSPGSHVFLFGSESLTKSPQMYCIGGSQVSLFSLEDRIIQSPSKLRGQCAESCLSISSFKRVGRNEMVSPLSGLRFKVEKLAKPVVINGRLREKLSFVAVTAWDNSRECHPVQKMSVPLPRGSTFRSARFEGGKDGCSYLLVVLNKLIMVWSTPTSSRGQFVLRLVQGIESDTKWRICLHNQLYGRKASHNNSNSNDGVEDNDEGLIDNRSLHNPTKGSDFSAFMNGISNLVEIYDLAVTVSSSATAAPAHSNNADDNDTAFLRHDILRYVSTYINCHPSDHHPDNSIVLHICESWTPIKHSATLLFLRSLLLANSDAPSAWWVPRPLTTHGRREGQGEGEGGNPIMCMINKARTDPQAMEVAKVLGEYFLRRARIDKDPYFLVSILQTLQELMVINSGNENLPTLGVDEFVAQLYRGFAYIPARRVNLPRGTMGREQKLPLVGTRVGLSPKKDMVAKEIYYASFDMLWYRTDSGSAVTGGGGSTNGGGGNGRMIFSRLGVLWRVYVHKFKFLTQDTVRCYPPVWHLGYNNPTLAVLVDYKWDTLGFGYWRDQFIARCCYYALVLVAVALQIYGKSKVGAEGSIVYSWIGIFFDISITSFIFLCVEVVQMFRQGLFYFRSVFNIADLLVFAFPFAGSLNHLCIMMGLLSSPPGQNSGFLSFSVLIVLFHFVLELRALKSVARVVWSIIHGVESIATFLCIYILGVLGFLAAFLHMIPACPDAASCQNPSSFVGSTLPSDFLGALSGMQLSGRNGWGGSGLFYTDNWVNFALALSFFLFNAIMFINMAIVLIQDASKKEAQEQWQQEWFRFRLKFVINAENMSYRISGARKDSKKFPDVVYYSATTEEIKVYEKETQSNN